MAHTQLVTEVQNPGSFKFSSGLKKFFGASAVLGTIAFLIALKTDPHRAWPNFLINFFFFVGLSAMGTFFTALQHICNAFWSVTVRRLAEGLMSFLPVAIVLAVVLMFGKSHLYEWMHISSQKTEHSQVAKPEGKTEDHATNAHHEAGVTTAAPSEAEHGEHGEEKILQSKQGYLNSTFFMIRTFSFLALWIFFGFWMRRNSLAQDITGDHKYTLSNIKLSAVFIPIFSLSFSFLSMDLIMSLEPLWFSTIFGVYCFAGIMFAGFSLMALMVLYGKKTNLFSEQLINNNHIHDIGKFMFVFIIFWAYIMFSQLMLQWYANLPEETPYYIRRFHAHWWPFFLFVFTIHFLAPFIFILRRDSKRDHGRLRKLAYVMLFAQWCDVYMMVMPNFYSEGPVFGWQELGIFMGFMGVFAISIGRFLEKVPAVPLKDPRLTECLSHVQ